MENIKECDIDELQDILYNIDSWDNISLKLNEIYSSTNVITSSFKHTKQLGVMLQKIRVIQNICDGIGDDIDNYFKNYGIYVDGNIDEMGEKIVKILKKKIERRLKNEMVNNNDACNNMKRYVEDYFDNYRIEKSTSQLTEHIKNWILIRQENPDLFPNI